MSAQPSEPIVREVAGRTHTPGPFSVSLGVIAVNLIGSDGVRIAEFWIRENTRANVDFVLKACNAHDDLIEALHEVEACTSLDSDANKIARAALAKVQP